ncbi:MAG TPA: biotin/lipoyl-containing protein [Terriglobales bacterium]|nr:biotin/lipoyl-containing protein [Terriglobales bacterium]
MEFEFNLEDKLYKITIEKKGEVYFVDLGNSKKEVKVQTISPNCLSLSIDGHNQTAYLADAENKKFVFVQGEQFIIQEKESAKVRKKEDEAGLIDGKQLVFAPMPGRILKILVSEGEKVRKKQSLAIVEAMKMEHEIKSALDGIVKKVNFKENQMVDTEEPIMELEQEK